MAAVVNHQIPRAVDVREFSQGSFVGLVDLVSVDIAHSYFDRVKVDPDDTNRFLEPLPPHSERSAVKDADFEKPDRVVSRKELLIFVRVAVASFVRSASVGNIAEVQSSNPIAIIFCSV